MNLVRIKSDVTKKNRRTALGFLLEVMRDPDRKSIFTIVYETVTLLFIYREIPVHYFTRYLFKKEITNFRDFLPNKFYDKITSHFNDKSVKDVLDDKLYFDMFYSKFNISLPKILMFNNKQIFVTGNKFAVVKNRNEFKIVLEELFSQNTSDDSVFIKKTNSSSSGKNIFKLLRSELIANSPKIDEIFSTVCNSEYIFQKTLSQHPDLNVLNSSCVNTIRIDTFIDKGGGIDVISAYLRMSLNNLYIDNIGSGGCFVGINLKTGTLKKTGYSTVLTSGANVMTQHPQSKTVFENFRIPYMPEVIDLVLKTASYMPGLRLIGWDVAITESGPVLIEGNWDYEIRGNDQADGGYLANPVFRKVLRELNYL